MSAKRNSPFSLYCFSSPTAFTIINVYEYLLLPTNYTSSSTLSKSERQYCDEYVCLCVCLSVREYISGTTRAIFTKFLCMLPMSVSRSSSGLLTMGRIAYRREGHAGSAQNGWLVGV